MPRIVLFVIVAALAAFSIVKLVRSAKRSELDWKGVAIAAGFVALAIYLRNTSGVPSLL